RGRRNGVAVCRELDETGWRPGAKSTKRGAARSEIDETGQKKAIAAHFVNLTPLRPPLRLPHATTNPTSSTSLRRPPAQTASGTTPRTDPPHSATPHAHRTRRSVRPPRPGSCLPPGPSRGDGRSPPQYVRSAPR